MKLKYVLFNYDNNFQWVTQNIVNSNKSSLNYRRIKGKQLL